jgi:uncharacterized protein YodC (DUF2158 family)
MSLSIGLVAIQSVPFSSAFLRIDGSNVTQSEGGGGGTVNCQFYPQGIVPVPNIGNDEVFELIPIPGVNNGFAIRSVNYSSAFLRIDGSNVTQFEGSGSGVVNCQFYSSGSYPTSGLDYELLIIGVPTMPVIQPDVYYIRSGPFPNAYLRMDGSTVTQSQGAGSGIVNCQYYSNTGPGSAQAYELFKIIPLQSYGGPW